MRRASDERGAAVVEVALVLPVVFLVLLGCLSLLWLFGARSAVTGAARDGARFASIRHDPLACEAPPCPTGYPTAEEVEAFVRNRAGSFGVDDVLVVSADVPNAPVSVTVRRRLPLLLTPLGAVFGDGDLTYQSEAKARAE